MNEALMEEVSKLSEEAIEIPLLSDWEPTEESQIFMEFKGDYVQAHYEKIGLEEGNKLGLFVIKKNHYKERMNEICNVINYYLTYFDKDLDLFKTTMSVKYLIDCKPNMSSKSFRKVVMDEIVNDDFVKRIKSMTDYLYTINIDSDTEGKYKNTPKISNDQAKSIVAITFAIRCVLPLCIHFSDTNNTFVNKKDYIPCFDKLIMKIIRKFEEDDIKVFAALEKFVQYRVDKFWKQDIGICEKKKQLYGMTQELYLEEVIHEVILVKSLYKLDYNRSVVSFIDGVIFLYHMNFKIENFKCKPIEIDPQEVSDDDSDRLSHAEAIEMMVYHIDESNALINDVNMEKVMRQIRRKFNLDIPEDEMRYYQTHIKISPISEILFESFYAKIFHDPNATINLDPESTVELLVYMKKYLQLKGLVLLPQLCTATMRGKYKENSIKNQKFLDKIRTSNVFDEVIKEKFTYVSELNPKEDLMNKLYSSFVNSQFIFIDYNGPEDGLIYDDVDQDMVIYELSLFLSII